MNSDSRSAAFNHTAGGLPPFLFQRKGACLFLVEGLPVVCKLTGNSSRHGTAWLEFKLAIVVLVIVPIEAADLWFSHRGLPQIFVSRRPDAPYTESEKRLLDLFIFASCQSHCQCC